MEETLSTIAYSWCRSPTLRRPFRASTGLYSSHGGSTTEVAGTEVKMVLTTCEHDRGDGTNTTRVLRQGRGSTKSLENPTQ